MWCRVTISSRRIPHEEESCAFILLGAYYAFIGRCITVAEPESMQTIGRIHLAESEISA
jgi:hypothetical protein